VPFASRFALAAALLTFVAPCLPAHGQEAHAADQPPQSTTLSRPSGKQRGPRPESQPVRITADQIIHDRDLNTVTASGHVEVDQGGRVLLADSLSYNLKQDVIIAAGNVSIKEVTGEVTFADYFELTGDMKDGAARGIRELMIDDSRVSAATGHRVGGIRSVFDNAIYTACKPCAEDPNAPPLWQLRAARVTHDETTHLIEYHDAWLEFDGVPVAYSPYMRHADPTVKRESGLLPPGIINNNVIGSGIRVPYFQVIDPYHDITVAPMVTSKNDEQAAILDRYRNQWGEAKTTASIANLSAEGYGGTATTGWHIDAYSRFDLDDTWRTGYQIQRSSDQTYLRAFGYKTTDPYLTTRPYLEGFGYRNYAALEGYSFQSLTTPVLPPGAVAPQKSPIVLPLATYNYVGNPSTYGGFWTFDTHAAAITRGEGTDSRRINTLTAWHLPYTTDDGELYRVTASMRADAYNSNDVIGQNSGMVNSGRLVPELAVDWRYPFTRLGEHSSQTISPIIMVSASPYGGNSTKIPNEDSLDFELDETNIFNPSPSSGYDRVITGPRVAYGAEYSVANRGMGAADIVLGQSYQLHPQDVLPQGTGLDDHLSDIVGRANVSPSTNVVLQYGFRLDHNDLTLRRSEIASSFGPRPLNLQTGYTFYDRLSPTSPFDSREQLNATLTAQISHYWSVQVYSIENLGVDAGPLQNGARLTYEDECFLVTADAGARHTTLKTFTAGHYFMLRIFLKTLTQFPVDVF
jgi:LPS-assembly protein